MQTKKFYTIFFYNLHNCNRENGSYTNKGTMTSEKTSQIKLSVRILRSISIHKKTIFNHENTVIDETLVSQIMN